MGICETRFKVMSPMAPRQAKSHQRSTDVTKSKSKSAARDSLLVVDAGGTKTAAWLVDLTKLENDRVVGRGRSRAGNPLSVGFAESTRAIEEAAASAQQEAGESAALRPRAILSIAGAANEKLRAQYVDWATTSGLADEVAVVSDVLPVLAAGTPKCFGVALVSGTGSVALCRDANGRIARCGGWGYLLGDEGSGYAIGRAGLQDALQALESLAAALQPLAEATRKAIGAKTVMDLTKTIYEDPDPRGVIASVAPIIITAADEGDTTAQAILDTAARDLAKLVGRAIRSIELRDRPIPLAIGGGVLVSSQRMRDRLLLELSGFGLDCQMSVVEEPLEGCIRLAAPEFAGTLVTWQ
jgi:N-acetylglucosamine kinase-like BadF-type ATPase